MSATPLAGLLTLALVALALILPRMTGTRAFWRRLWQGVLVLAVILGSAAAGAWLGGR